MSFDAMSVSYVNPPGQQTNPAEYKNTAFPWYHIQNANEHASYNHGQTSF